MGHTDVDGQTEADHNVGIVPESWAHRSCQSFTVLVMKGSSLRSYVQRVPVLSYGGWLTVGNTQKGDIVKELMQTAYNCGMCAFIRLGRQFDGGGNT